MPAVNRYYSSVAIDTTLSFSITSTDLTLVVGSTAGFPTSYPYTLALGFDLSNEELVTIVAASGTTLTVGTSVAGGANVSGRGVDGTNDQAHAAGEPVKHVISARDMTESQAHIAAETGAHGITGSFVGTTDTQTLTNKTITGGTVNPTTLQQGGVAAVTTTGTQTLTNKTIDSASNTLTGVVTLTGTQTLTNKTLTSPVITGGTVNSGAALTVDSTELNYVDGVTSAIQTQLDSKAPLNPSTNAQTGTTYTLVLGDAGKYVEMNNASANTLTVPPNSDVAFSVGTEITVIRTGAGLTTIAPGSGVTVNYYSVSGSGTRSIKGQWSAATLVKRATDTWVLIGNLT